MGTRWKPEEDAILYANPEKGGSELVDIIPGRTKEAINQRRSNIGIAKRYPRRSPIQKLEKFTGDPFLRPLARESAYHIRTDYAAKIKRGYTHEQAVKWLVEANMRYQHIIEDVLTNPKYDAEVAACRRKAML